MKELADKALRDRYIAQYDLQRQFPINLLSSSLVEFSPREHLCSQGAQLESVLLLVKGKVKIYVTSPEGKRLIVAFNNPLEIFGDVELVQNVDIFNTVEAVGIVHAFVIPVSELRLLMTDNIALLHFLLEWVTRKFYTKSKTLSFHLLNAVDVRFASYLLSFTHDEYGQLHSAHIGKKVVKEIAEFIGTSTRHQNRLIKEFTEEGILKRENSGIVIIDTQKLMKRAQQNIFEMQ